MAKKKNIIQRLFSNNEQKVEKRAFVNAGFLGGESNGPLSIDTQGALKIDIVYAVIKVISESFASLPTKVYSKSNDVVKKEKLHDQYDLLKSNPSKLYTSLAFKRSLAVNYLVYGNAYAKIIRDRNGRPVSYRILDSKDIMPFLVELPDGTEEIWYKSWEKDYILKGEDVLHFADLSSDPCYGVSRITQHAELLGMSKASLDFRNKLYNNGLKLSGVVSYPTEAQVSNDQLRELRASFQGIYGGVQEGTKVAFLNNGAKFDPVKSSMNFADVQHIESEKFTRESILAIFLCPAAKIGMGGESKYSNIEQMQGDFDKNVLMPLCITFEQEFNRKIFRDSEKRTHYVKCEMDALSRADMSTRSEYFERAINSGQMTINEARAYQDLAPVENGDTTLIMANNLFPLDKIQDFADNMIKNNNTDNNKIENDGE